jgi:hypothetical protein
MDGRPTIADEGRKPDAIHRSGRSDVGEHETDIWPGVEDCDRSHGIVRVQTLETGVFFRFDREKAQQWIIFNYQNRVRSHHIP